MADDSQEESSPGNGLLPNKTTPEKDRESLELEDLEAWLDQLEGDYPIDSNVVHYQKNEDFEDPDIINHSDKLTNARFATVDSFNNPTNFTTVESWMDSNYVAANAIDGVVELDSYHGDCVARDRSTQAWFADITGHPSISFVKVWPSYHTQFGRAIERNWGFYWTYRVFVNDIECYPIQYYSDDRALELYQSRKPFIFKCIDTIPNANVVRLSAGSYGGHSPQYIFFSEVEVLEFVECPTEPDEMFCNDSQLNNDNTCIPNYCGIERGSRPQQNRCANLRCSCTNVDTNEIVEYDLAKCTCPSNRRGKRCEIDITPYTSQGWL